VNGYLLGSDGLGRDVLVRTAYGARTSLTVAILATAFMLIVAALAGTLAGYFGHSRANAAG
jgi:peptide/nickel transport system permease protein